MKETEIAKDVVAYLKDFDLYFEVMDVDIIAKLGNILTAVEVKTSLNFKVIEQAVNNKLHFHYSYIAIPFTKNSNFQYKICKDYGIGVIELTYDKATGLFCDASEKIKPRLNRHAFTKGLILTDEDKKSIPGASGRDGTTRSAFKITLELLENYVNRHPGCTLKELLSNTKHHYHSFTSAKNSIARYIREGIIGTLQLKDGKLYLTEHCKIGDWDITSEPVKVIK